MRKIIHKPRKGNIRGALVLLLGALTFCVPTQQTLAAAAPGGSTASAVNTVTTNRQSETETEELIPETENMIPFSQGIEFSETPGEKNPDMISDEMPGQAGEGRQAAKAPGQPIPEVFSDDALWGNPRGYSSDTTDSASEESAMEHMSGGASEEFETVEGKMPPGNLPPGARPSAGGAGINHVTEPQVISEIPADDITLNAEYGLEGMAKGGRYLPLTVTIGNDRAEFLEGSLLVKSLESDGTIYQYEYDVEVE